MVKKHEIDNSEPVIFQTEKVIPPVKKGFFRRNRLKRLFFFTLLFIAIAGVYGSVHYYNKYQTLKNDPNAEAVKQTNALVEMLGKLMELPTGETPTVATISDKEKLQGQSFFAQAENGDILFAYTTAMKAILYRPSANKIINVAPITIDQQKDVVQAVKKEATVLPSVPKKRP